MSLAVTYPDVERAVRDNLAAVIGDYEPDVTVGVGGPPSTWVAGESPPHIHVECDGTPAFDHPIVAHSTIRLVAWSDSTTRSKALVNAALGLVLAFGATGDISAVLPLTGILPARDPDNRGELAAGTVRVSVRSTPLEPSGS